MCELLDELWGDFETSKQSFESHNSTVEITFNVFECKCGGQKVIGPDNMPVCFSCGLLDRSCIDDTPEWTNGVSESGVSKDASRCGNLASDTELFSTAWGTGTVIHANYKASYAARRMARVNFHSSMNHKDRSLFHAYKDIEDAAKNILQLPDSVVRDAKVMYKKFNTENLTRGAVRLGIKANCVMYACKLSNMPRTTKEIAAAFGIPTKDINRTSDQFRETILSDVQKSEPTVTRAADIMHRLLNLFDSKGQGEARIKCMKMSRRLDDCVSLMAKTPNSIAAVVIQMVLGLTRQEVSEKCGVSLPTMAKIEKLIKTYLEETV